MQIVRNVVAAGAFSLLFCVLACCAEVKGECDSASQLSGDCLQEEDVNSLLQVKVSTETFDAKDDSVSAHVAWEGFEYWEKAFCLTKGARGKRACKKLLKDTRDYCDKHKKEGVFNSRCTEFKAAADVKEKKGTRAIADAVKKCEPAALSVCKESTCPAYCAMTEKEDCDCESMCDEASSGAFGNREIDCLTEDGKKIEHCLEKHYKKMKSEGKAPELEALLREHVVKCVCVNRQENTSDCYSGSQGIPKGKPWCEFAGTPSWQRLVKSAKSKPDGATAPSCSSTAGSIQK